MHGSMRLRTHGLWGHGEHELARERTQVCRSRHNLLSQREFHRVGPSLGLVTENFFQTIRPTR
jgi:hypothetical protein